MTRGEWERALRNGEVISCDLSPRGSNYTFFTTLRCPDGGKVRAVYKPREGEMPLWDFPAGTLYRREYASYLLSELLGWRVVPPSVLRDGPYGPGVFQLFIEHDPEVNYFTLRDTAPDRLRAIALFDLVANNADRKASHCIQGPDGWVWGIDHGLTFHVHDKLRTVIWDFVGEAIPSPLLSDLERLLGLMERPPPRVRRMMRLLHPREVTALKGRIRRLLASPFFPELGRRRIPWPIF